MLRTTIILRRFFKPKKFLSVVCALALLGFKNPSPILIDGEKLQNTLISGKLLISDDINEVMQYLAKTLEAKYVKNKNGDFLIKNYDN